MKSIIIDINAFENVISLWMKNKKALHYGVIIGGNDGAGKDVIFSLIPFNKEYIFVNSFSEFFKIPNLKKELEFISSRCIAGAYVRGFFFFSANENILSPISKSIPNEIIDYLQCICGKLDNGLLMTTNGNVADSQVSVINLITKSRSSCSVSSSNVISQFYFVSGTFPFNINTTSKNLFLPDVTSSADHTITSVLPHSPFVPVVGGGGSGEEGRKSGGSGGKGRKGEGGGGGDNIFEENVVLEEFLENHSSQIPFGSLIQKPLLFRGLIPLIPKVYLSSSLSSSSSSSSSSSFFSSSSFCVSSYAIVNKTSTLKEIKDLLREDTKNSIQYRLKYCETHQKNEFVDSFPIRFLLYGERGKKDEPSFPLSFYSFSNNLSDEFSPFSVSHSSFYSLESTSFTFTSSSSSSSSSSPSSVSRTPLHHDNKDDNDKTEVRKRKDHPSSSSLSSSERKQTITTNENTEDDDLEQKLEFAEKKWRRKRKNFLIFLLFVLVIFVSGLILLKIL